MGLLPRHPLVPCSSPPGLRRRLLFGGLILAGLLIWLGGGRAWAQGNDRPHYVPKSEFRIPFNIDANNPRLLEVQLFYSEDQGQTWQRAGAAAPETGGFRFRAERDGLYFFTVQTVDINGKASPPNVQGVAPQIRVHVDTQAPLVTLRQALARDGQVGVEWDIREENLDVNSLFLEYRTANNPEWIALPVDGGRTGQKYWSPGVSGNVEARLRVRDLAKNEGEDRRTLTAGGGASDGGREYRQLGGNYNDPEAGRSTTAGSSRTAPRYVNSKRISLNYEIKEEGPSGTSAVELWVTRDGKAWDKHMEDASHQPPLTVEVTDEDVYGFTLVARSGVGLVDRRPRSGDAPQVWVEVDLHPPVVAFVDATVDPGPDTGKLTIAWKATDKNLGREPINLSYSKEPDGPWTPIAPNPQQNNGSYVWHMPAGIPYQFYIQVEATDKAGNVGKGRTKELVKVDLKKPKSIILDVGPATSAGPKSDSESNKR